MLNKMQAYQAMFEFLNDYNQRAQSEEISLLLGFLDKNLFDGKPMDPAMWEDWICAVDKVMKS